MESVIPPGHYPGMMMEINLADGRKVSIQVPPGVVPGQKIRFEVPDAPTSTGSTNSFLSDSSMNLSDEAASEIVDLPDNNLDVSTLMSSVIPCSGDALEYFGETPGLLVAIPGRGWAPYLMVPEGFYALVTTSGAEILTPSGSPVWPAGIIPAGPFTRISHLVTKSYCVFDVPVKGCKTADNVTVTIDCSIVFRIMGDAAKGEDPELVRTFVHNCTPAGLEQQLKDAMAEEIRYLARSMKHTEVYTARKEKRPELATEFETLPVKEDPLVPTKKDPLQNDDSMFGAGGGEGIEMLEASSGVAEAEVRPYTPEEKTAAVGADITAAMEDRLNAQFNPQGVSIQDIMIQNIRLPRGIEHGMSSKTLVRSKQEYEVMEQKFGMQEIQLNNEQAKVQLEYQEKEEMARVEGSKDVQASRDALAERKAERDKALADFKQGTITEERKIRAEMNEETTKLKYECKQVLQTLKLEAQETAARIEADSKAKAEELTAETRLRIAELEGEAKLSMSNAENESNEFLKKKREYALRGKKLDVYEGFASNAEVVLSNSKESDFNMLMLADNVLVDEEGAGRKDPDYIQSELNRLRLAANAYGLKEPGDVYIPDNKLIGAP